MSAVLVTTQAGPWVRRIRITGRLLLSVVVMVLHLVVAVIVLAVRIAHVITTVVAAHAAYTELYLSRQTGRPALGQAAGVAIAAAFTDEFHRARTGATSH